MTRYHGLDHWDFTGCCRGDLNTIKSDLLDVACGCVCVISVLRLPPQTAGEVKKEEMEGKKRLNKNACVTVVVVVINVEMLSHCFSPHGKTSYITTCLVLCYFVCCNNKANTSWVADLGFIPSLPDRSCPAPSVSVYCHLQVPPKSLGSRAALMHCTC